MPKSKGIGKGAPGRRRVSRSTITWINAIPDEQIDREDNWHSKKAIAGSEKLLALLEQHHGSV